MTHREEEYATCLEMKLLKLDGIYREDEARLAKNIELVRGRADKIKSDIKKILKRQQEELQMAL